AEYFFDTDPGFGMGINIPVTFSANIANQSVAVNINALSTGIHNLYLRTRSASGHWSLTTSMVFVKLVPSNTTVTAAEYYFDNDPGTALGTAISLTAGAHVNAAIEVPIANLSLGLHNLYVRTKDANGRWSLTQTSPFVKLNAPNAHITRAEYFIDTDPGIGQAVPVAMTAGNPKVGFAIPVNLTGLSAGTHKLYLRSLNALGQWSITNVFEFTYSAPAAAPRIQINAITRKQMCASEGFDISVDATGTYNPGNQMQVQLSDATGSFASPMLIGTATTQTDVAIRCTLPRRLPDGNNYRIRVVSTNPAVTGIAADTTFTLRDRPDLGPDVTALIVCQQETVNLNPLFTTTGLTTQWSTANTTNAPAGNYQLIVTNAAGCKDTALAIVRQDIATWLGVNANGWHNAANWSTGTIPTVKTHVIINSGTPNPCVLSGTDGNAASIQLRNGATITVGAGRKITVSASCSTLPL
ncbi:MAG TPA: hypothetical protein PKD90_08795, partial [Phnomibacter sp.]|nr:hypothetical protein [Phnomibacter sp.]